MNDGMSIGELADRAGLSRRAVRFYVQQKLLPPPEGGGRGSRYTEAHVERLARIGQLQAAGHSLEGIRRILEGKEAPPPVGVGGEEAVGKWSAELWTRVKIVEGVELHVDARRRGMDVMKLAAIRAFVLEVMESNCNEK